MPRTRALPSDWLHLNLIRREVTVMDPPYTYRTNESIQLPPPQGGTVRSSNRLN